MWGALQDAARTITLLLDKNCDSHRKCPRCRGSGLLGGNASTRLEKKAAHPNQPCWFCEGIGSLPIAGLNGFVLARATTRLKALDNHNQPCVDVLQLNHGRYSKETCKFTNANVGVNLADLLFDLNKSPWIKCTSLGCQQNVLEKPEANESIIQPSVSEPRLHLSSFSQKGPCLRNGFFERILKAPLVPSIVNNLQPNARLSPAPLVSNLQLSAILVPVNQKTPNIRPALKLRGAFAMQHASYTQKASYCNVSTIDDLHLEPEFSEPFITKQQTQTASNVVRPKRRRLQRNARNCIRDKVKKEVQERAQGLLSSLKHDGGPDLTDSHVQPECTERTSKSLQGSGTHGEHFLPSDVPSRVAWLTTVAVVSRQVLLNRLLAGGFKVLMPTSANSTR